MTHESFKAAQPINELGTEGAGETSDTRKQDSVFLKRGRRRRLDLRNLAGTLRESAKVYREFVKNEISANEAEIRSRLLRRHAEGLTSLEQQQHLLEIERKLEAIEARQNGRLLPVMQKPDAAALPAFPIEDDGVSR